MIDTTPSAATMRGWAINGYGAPMVLMELPMPQPGPHLAVQIASLLGARVVATASERNHAFLTNLGAETVIDHADVDDMTKAIRANYPGGVDKCLNGVSGEPAKDYVFALKEGGKLVDLPGTITAERPGVDIISDYVVRGDGARLAELAKLFDNGDLQLAIHDTVAFIDAPDALDMVLTKHVRGKVVLEIV